MQRVLNLYPHTNKGRGKNIIYNYIIYIYIYTHTHTYTYTYIYIYTHTHAHIYIYIYNIGFIVCIEKTGDRNGVIASIPRDLKEGKSFSKSKIIPLKI